MERRFTRSALQQQSEQPIVKESRVEEESVSSSAGGEKGEFCMRVKNLQSVPEWFTKPRDIPGAKVGAKKASFKATFGNACVKTNNVEEPLGSNDDTCALPECKEILRKGQTLGDQQNNYHKLFKYVHPSRIPYDAATSRWSKVEDEEKSTVSDTTEATSAASVPQTLSSVTEESGEASSTVSDESMEGVQAGVVYDVTPEGIKEAETPEGRSLRERFAAAATAAAAGAAAGLAALPGAGAVKTAVKSGAAAVASGVGKVYAAVTSNPPAKITAEGTLAPFEFDTKDLVDEDTEKKYIDQCKGRPVSTLFSGAAVKAKKVVSAEDVSEKEAFKRFSGAVQTTQEEPSEKEVLEKVLASSSGEGGSEAAMLAEATKQLAEMAKTSKELRE